MLAEDANAALNRMLQAGYSTGAIKLDTKFSFLKDGYVPVAQGGQAVDEGVDEPTLQHAR
jgi:hypothetical protein